MKLDTRLRRFLGYALIAGGALAVMSAGVNIYAACQLIESAEAESLGVSRGELIVTYAVIALVGAGMILGGWRLKK